MTEVCNDGSGKYAQETRKKYVKWLHGCWFDFSTI